MTHLRSRRAFVLVEMLIVIGIIAVVLVIEGRLFKDTMLAIQTSNAAENQINSVTRMSWMLRQDVWGASSIGVPDPGTIVLGRPDGTSVRWEFSDVQAFRTDGAEDAALRQSWEIALPVRARRDGPAIVLDAGPVSDGAAAEMRLISQVILAGGSP